MKIKTMEYRLRVLLAMLTAWLRMRWNEHGLGDNDLDSACATSGYARSNHWKMMHRRVRGKPRNMGMSAFFREFFWSQVFLKEGQ